MNKFIVSARKYRPQLFSTVVGQSHITTTLKNAIRNKQLAHAFLFCGPRGVGKTTCARILAKAINCENPAPDGEACNACHSCISFQEGSSLNIHELDAASNNSVDDIRSLVEQVRFAPQPGKYKVYIIDEVHMLSSSAFNAFLKTLEEPPPYAIFILATTEKYKILPTILSRCQVFDFKRITNQDIIDHLQEICEKENIPVEKSSLEIIAQKSEGCMRDALSIMDKMVSFSNGKLTYLDTLEHLNILDDGYYFKLLASIREQKLSEALLIFDEINRKGFEGDLLLNGFAEFIRNLLICKDEKAAILLDVVDEFKQKYIEEAKEVEGSYLISALNLLSESEIHFKAARNKRLHIELAIIKLAYLNQALHLSLGITDKRKGTEAVKPVAYRIISPLEIKDKKSANSSTILTPEHTTPATKTGQGPKLIIEESKTAGSESTSLGALSKIRQEVVSRKISKETAELKSLEPILLMEVWNQFTAELKKNKNSAAQSFEGAELRILDELRFEILTNNNLEHRFVEQEKRKLSDLLQEKFNNKNISFSVTIREQDSNHLHLEKTWSKRDQFLQIVEMYPLVKELKDKLKLELDY
ncbi:MAG TPA: DNA polymerase III subunit gamma/tau [Puia sp.]|jgi:DNA polymerase-3 subunit gamma/tau|nr:DNA polymerase III subunit gamma/tau [Puia sp.]